MALRERRAELDVWKWPDFVFSGDIFHALRSWSLICSLTGFLPTAQGLVVLLCQLEGIMGQISKPLAQAQ